MKVYISPMSGYTDYAYRQILKKFNPDLMFCEMLNVNLDIESSPLLKMSDDEKTGVQLFGSDIQKLYQGFLTLNKMGIKDLCLNMGCPQPKIYKRGAGANMLDNYEEIDYLMQSLYKKQVYISLKIRSSENTLKYFELSNKYDSPFFCIHPRTKEQLFSGSANWNEIEKLSKLDRKFHLIGNGDINSYEAYKNIENINIDGVMLARGIVGNPFLIKEIKEDKKYIKNIDEVKKLVLEHLELLANDKNEFVSSMQINKFLKGYFKDFDVDVKKIIQIEDYNKKKKLISEL